VENTKLHVKIGNSEFNAEGPQEWVKEAYERFLQSCPANTNSSASSQDSANTLPLANPLDQGLMERAFIVKEDVVSLRHLPTVETVNRTADAAILVLYGFKRLLKIEDVPVMKLNEGLRQSGITVERLDRYINVHSQLYRRGGARSGGRYSLTNSGETQADKWLKMWYAE
jgi:hypothetical protein